MTGHSWQHKNQILFSFSHHARTPSEASQTVLPSEACTKTKICPPSNFMAGSSSIMCVLNTLEHHPRNQCQPNCPAKQGSHQNQNLPTLKLHRLGNGKEKQRAALGSSDRIHRCAGSPSRPQHAPKRGNWAKPSLPHSRASSRAGQFLVLRCNQTNLFPHEYQISAEIPTPIFPVASGRLHQEERRDRRKLNMWVSLNKCSVLAREKGPGMHLTTGGSLPFQSANLAIQVPEHLTTAHPGK